MAISRMVRREEVVLVRAEDQLLVSVVLENLRMLEAGVTPIGPDPGFLTLVLPPQHTVESIATEDPTPSGPYENRVAGPSQLRFEIAPGTVIPYTVKGLLGWTERTLVLDPRGAVSGSPYPTTKPTTTFVEMPQALYLSPGVEGRFVTEAQPRTFGAVTELWRMRLGREQTVDGVPVVLEPPHTEVRVRAIWTDDHEAAVPAADWSTTPDDEFPQRLPTRLDERHMVRAMGDHDMDEKEYPAHEAATVRRLWMSLSGGWLTVDGSWSGFGVLAAWAQRIATGRDAHVRVTHRGWLAPFGHVASVVLIAERKFEVDAGGGVTAALRHREFLSVSANTVDMETRAGAMPHAGRELPFRVIDLVSNFILEISRSPIPDVVDDTAVFLPTHVADSGPVHFDYTASDRTNAQQSHFTMPGVFIRADATPADVAAVIHYYGGIDSADIRAADFGGQPVAYADEPPGTEGDGKTTLPTWLVSFTVGAPTTPLPDGIAALVPAMETATVIDEKVDTLRGEDSEPFMVHMAGVWLEHGLDLGANVALGFLDLDLPITLPFSGGGSGITAPDLKVGQLTALLGPAMTLTEGGTWDPLEALGDKALFMGSVKLAQLIEKINIGGDILAEHGLPRYDIELHRPNPQALPDALCISLTWNPTMKSFPDTLMVAQDITEDSPFPADAEGELDFLIKHCLPLDDLDAEAETTVDIAVRNIMIQLPPPNPIIAVAFTKIRFLDPPDGPMDVDVDIAAVRFLGSLAFLDPIQEFLAGLGGGPRLEIRDDAIEADLTFPLPDISLGILGITGLEVGTGLIIDLTGGPLRSAFNLGTRSDPFTLSVMGFGGSGSLELEASPHPVGIVRLELSLAFVIELTVDVVVAKGSLRASFGASLEVKAILVDGQVSADVTLGAFLDIVGEVQAFGLISVVVQVLLTLEYTASTGLLVGTATVTAMVDVGFIEKELSFTISQEMALGGDSGAQSALTRGMATDTAGGFATRFPTPPLWDAYCAAFAASKGQGS